MKDETKKRLLEAIIIIVDAVFFVVVLFATLVPCFVYAVCLFLLPRQTWIFKISEVMLAEIQFILALLLVCVLPVIWPRPYSDPNQQ